MAMMIVNRWRECSPKPRASYERPQLDDRKNCEEARSTRPLHVLRGTLGKESCFVADPHHLQSNTSLLPGRRCVEEAPSVVNRRAGQDIVVG